MHYARTVCVYVSYGVAFSQREAPFASSRPVNSVSNIFN